MSVSSDTITQVKVLSSSINALVAESQAKDRLILDLKAKVLALTPKQKFTWSNINQKQGWLAPGNVGDTGGGSGAPAGTSVLTPGHPLLERFIAGHPWNNAYVYLELDKITTDNGVLIQPGGLGQLSMCRVSLSLSLPAEKKVWQALEFELQLATSGWVYNMAWQLRPDGTLWAFQFMDKQWVDTQLTFRATDLDAGLPVNLTATFHPDQGNSETHTQLMVNGLVLPVNFTQAAAPGAGEYLHAAFQVDSDKAMDPYTLAVDNMSVEVS